jgi:hypothetical protein
MDIEKALRLTSAKELKRACIDAETHNVDIEIVRELYRRYYMAVEKEEMDRLRRIREGGKGTLENIRLNNLGQSMKTA